MKQVKAYIRCKKAEDVLAALENIGITGVTLIDVMGMGPLADPNQSKYSLRCIKKYSDLAKLEIVCSDADAEQIVELIRKTAHTGMPGDGMIYVAPVEMAVKIRTGTIGEEAL